MRFISNGDYIFPFEAYFYNVKHLFLWSYQNGTANPDGVIRLPGRALNLLVFSWFGNIAMSYFFLATSLLVVFVAFYYFSRVFLDNIRPAVALICSLLFTFNPIFLGNLAKIGLILAAAMLPPSLAVIRRAFETERLRYLLLWVVFMNISLIHPFTFTVNFAVSLAYFAYMCRKHRGFLKGKLLRIGAIGLTALALNAYFILPIASMGTVSKDALSSDVTATPINYTSLVDVANTGDVFTGLSLSKNVLKDFEFYSPLYQNFYFLGAFVLYIVLLGIYVRVEGRLELADKKRFGAFLVAFLVLILLATVKLWHVDDFIKMLIQLPGGWMFRSPLKWQLYIPLVLFSMLAIVLVHIYKPWKRRLMYGVLGFSFLLMNGFIIVNIYHDLLVPRQLSYFQSLQAMDFKHQNLLVVGSEKCFSFADEHPPVMTELNQVLISKDLQVKQVGVSDLDTVNLGTYDYILGCQNTLLNTLPPNYQFKLQQQFVDGAFQFYTNQDPRAYVFSADSLIALDKPQSLSATAEFAQSALALPFNTVSADVPAANQATGIQDLFDKLTFDNIKQGAITADITPIRSGKQVVYFRQQGQLYYQQQANKLTLSTTERDGFTPLAQNNAEQILELDLQAGKQLQVSYLDAGYSYLNLIANPSLEKGTWQPKVGDCYDYNGQADLKMDIAKGDASAGNSALRLQARSHIACTGPSEVAVKPGQHYLLSLDYKNVGGTYAGYYIDFDDPAQTTLNGRLKGKPGDWQNFVKNIIAPEGARSMRVIVYGYPDGSGTTYGTALYDNFKLAAVPDIQGRFHLVNPAAEKMTVPAKVEYLADNPTKNTIRVTGATTPFVLGTHESYNDGWRLHAGQTAQLSAPAAGLPQTRSGGQNAAAEHLRLNGSMNGWLIDPGVVCGGQNAVGCIRNADGSYTMTLTMEFAPQRLVYVGGVISGIAAIGALGYFMRDLYGDSRSRRFWHGRKHKPASGRKGGKS